MPLRSFDWRSLALFLLVLSLAGCAAFFEDYQYQPISSAQSSY